MNEKISIGVGAVVFRGDEVLVIKRGKKPFLGQWSIPGGGLHYGERLLEAVAREVREETAVEINILGLLDVFKAAPHEAGGEILSHTLLIDYVADWVSGDPVAGDDAADAEFVSLEEAERRLSWNVTRQAVARAAEWRAGFRRRP